VATERVLELIALRQAQRRSFNELLAELDPLSEGLVPVRCECALVACAATLKLTPAEYSDVRDHRAHFVVLASHVEPEADTVVAAERGWVVIEKPEGTGRDVAMRTNSRRMQLRASWALDLRRSADVSSQSTRNRAAESEAQGL
jgi:hypothetical protein